ncbi:MAG TPA: hypothetical protein VFA45_06005 [Actinomycetes bacterium]|nr:hypothetical protein [Actinomycetes bacterium]
MSAPRRMPRLWGGVLVLAVGLSSVLMSADGAVARPCRDTCGSARTSPPDPSPPAPQPPPPAGAGQPPHSDNSGSITNQFLGDLRTSGLDAAPLGNYHIYYDDGSFKVIEADFNKPHGDGRAGGSPVKHAQGWLTDSVFTLERWVTGLGLRVLRLAYDSELLDWVGKLIPPAAQAADVINGDILGPLNLAGFFLLLAFLYTAWQVFRGRAALGIREFGLSLVILLTALLVLQNPVRGVQDSMTAVIDVGGELMSASLSNGLTVDGVAGANRCPTPHESDARHAAVKAKAKANSTGGLSPDFEAVECVLRVQLIDVPYDLLNWGKVIKPNDLCWKARQSLLQKAPDSSDQEGVEKALGEDCRKLFKGPPGVDRFFAAVLLAVFGVMVMSVLIGIALITLIALVTIIFLLIWSWPAFALGLLPNSGRQLFWRYVVAVGVAFAAVLVSYAGGAFLLWAEAQTFQAASEAGLPYMMQYGAAAAISYGVMRANRSWRHRVTARIRDWGDRMPGAQGAGSGGGRGLAGAGAGGGGGPVNWGGSPANPRPGSNGRGLSAWVQPASYQSPRLAAPNELAHQLHQTFWRSRPARPLVRARHNLATLYPVRHPIRTVTSPFRFLTHPIASVRNAWRPLEAPNRNPDGDRYPNNHHPWVPN